MRRSSLRSIDSQVVLPLVAQVLGLAGSLVPPTKVAGRNLGPAARGYQFRMIENSFFCSTQERLAAESFAAVRTVPDSATRMSSSCVAAGLALEQPSS